MFGPLTTSFSVLLLLSTPLSIAASRSPDINLGQSLSQVRGYNNATLSRARLDEPIQKCTKTKRASILKTDKNISLEESVAPFIVLYPLPEPIKEPIVDVIPPVKSESESKPESKPIPAPEGPHDDPIPQKEDPVTPPYEEPVSTGWGGLKPVQYWSGNNFLDGFEFFTREDPTNGHVNYVDGDQARREGLAYTDDRGNMILRVDNSSWLSPGARRNSVRVTSLQPMTIGSVLVFDFEKLPFGASVWPAAWTVGSDWPSRGEVDIVEGVDNQEKNMMALHTGEGCRLDSNMQATGTVRHEDCNAFATGNNLGCGVVHDNPHSFGEAFNSKGGGVYVMSWNYDGISIWMFHRDNIPQDIANKSPKYENWGTPAARFAADLCDMNQHFGDQTIVINLTLCGDWAGSTNENCHALVENPNNYHDAAFSIRSVAVYH